jgi:mannose-6-phosphate isomerase-like protein (cupin superfamily)
MMLTMGIPAHGVPFTEIGQLGSRAGITAAGCDLVRRHRVTRPVVPGYGHDMVAASMIISPQYGDAPGLTVRGTSLVIQDWPISGVASEVAPLHVHLEDDEAWHVVSGALRFRFKDEEVIARAGSTVLVPAGIAHTQTGPSTRRYTAGISPSFWNDEAAGSYGPARRFMGCRR